MKCPECKNKLKVVDTRSTNDGVVYRRYHCRTCQYVCGSVEHIDNSPEIRQEYLELKVQMGHEQAIKKMKREGLIGAK